MFNRPEVITEDPSTSQTFTTLTSDYQYSNSSQRGEVRQRV